MGYFRSALGGTQVHTIHAEVEGRSKAPLFTRILDGWIADGAGFVALEELANETLARREDVPVRPLARTTLPGRGGTVATGWPEASAAG